MLSLRFWPRATEKCPPRLPWRQIAAAFCGAALAIAVLAQLQSWQHISLILGSFGASCLLVFAYPLSPFAQPRNLIGGHAVSSLTGLVVMSLCGVHPWSMALAVGTAVALMLVLRVPHPPAGSNPLIVMISGAGWEFLLTPTLAGAVLLAIVAFGYHNGVLKQRYPSYWW